MTIIKKFDTSGVDKPKNTFSGLPKKFVSLALFGIFILIVLEVWANNTVVAYGEKFDDISALQQALRTENQILENKIAYESSLANIASQSALLGFSKTEDVEYIR